LIASLLTNAQQPGHGIAMDISKGIRMVRRLAAGLAL
jgi:hypothetical protein